MRVVYMGTPDFAVPTLRELIKAGHEVAAVVTQPDRPKGRGQKLTPPPVKIAAAELNLRVLQPERVKTPEFVKVLTELNPDVIVVAAFGQILSKEILQLPKYGCINVHASILPKYRGAAPIHWAVINGEQESGVSIMYMDEGLDTGDVLKVARVPIAENDTTGDVHDKLALVGAAALIDALQLLEAGTAPRTPQNDAESNYAPLLNKQVELIDWAKSSKEIKDLVRGLNPWPGAFTYLEGKVMKVWAGEVVHAPNNSKHIPGQIITADANGGIVVASGNGAVALKEIQLQGSKRMAVEDFLRGRSLVAGQSLGTPGSTQ